MVDFWASEISVASNSFVNFIGFAASVPVLRRTYISMSASRYRASERFGERNVTISTFLKPAVGTFVYTKNDHWFVEPLVLTTNGELAPTRWFNSEAVVEFGPRIKAA